MMYKTFTGYLPNETKIYDSNTRKPWLRMEKDENGIFTYGDKNISEAFVTRENVLDDPRNYNTNIEFSAKGIKYIIILHPLFP